MDGTRGYYRVLPLGRTVPHIHRVYNIIWTSGETAAQSWYTPLRQGGIYPAKYLATSGPYHNPQSPFYYPSATTTIGSWWHSIVSLVPPAIDAFPSMGSLLYRGLEGNISYTVPGSVAMEVNVTNRW